MAARSQISAECGVDFASIPEVLDFLEHCKPPPRYLSAGITCAKPLDSGVLAGLSDGKIVLLPADDQETITVLEATQSATAKVTCMERNARGTKAVIGREDGAVSVWDLVTLQEVCGWQQSASIRTVAIDADREIYASGDDSGLVETRNTDLKLGEWQGSNPVTCLAILENSVIASFAGESTVQCFVFSEFAETIAVDLYYEIKSILSVPAQERFLISTEAEVVAVESGERASLISISATLPPVLTPNSQQLVIATDNQVVAFALSSSILQELYEHVKKVTCLSLTSDGHSVLSASADHAIIVYSLATSQVMVTISEPELTIERLLITRNCRHFALCVGAEIHFRSLEERVMPLESFGSPVRTLAVSRDGGVCLARLATRNCVQLDLREGGSKYLGPEREAVLIDDRVKMSKVAHSVEKLSPNAEAQYLQKSGHFFSTSCLGLTPDGCFAVVGEACDVLVWDLETNTQQGQLTGHSDTVSCLDISADGKWVVSGSLDRTLMLWDLPGLTSKAALTGHNEAVICVAISPDTAKCVSGAMDFTAKVWALPAGQLLTTLSEHKGPVRCLTITPSRVVTGSADKALKIWSLDPLSNVSLFTSVTDRINCVAVTPDGRFALSAGEEKKVRVWNLAYLKEEACLEGHQSYIQCLAVSPDGQACLSGGKDGVVVMWDLTCFSRRTTRKAHLDLVNCVCFLPDGRHVISASEDWSLAMFDLERKIGVQRLHPSLDGLCCVSSEFQACLSALKTGEQVWSGYTHLIIPHYRLYLHHIYAYYDHPQAIQTLLTASRFPGRGLFGSPLTVAMDRRAMRCVNVLLQSLCERLESEADNPLWVLVEPYEEDLPALLQFSSPYVLRLLHLLLQPADSATLPKFITPSSALPICEFSPRRYVDVRKYHAGAAAGVELVDFLVSLVRLNVTGGSKGSLEFLQALADCENRELLGTKYVTTVIEEKWRQYYPCTLALTLLYCLLLAALASLLFQNWQTELLRVLFCGLNCFFLLYELLQMATTGVVYWSDPWNEVDLARALLSLYWTWWLSYEMEHSLLTLAVTFLCFLRGFTYFRSFRMTRTFVYMTTEVIKQVYTFLIIMAYSVFSFGTLASVLAGERDLAVSWTSAFNLIMGNFENSQYNSTQWVVFVFASVINVIVMLNLLISILGEAYGQTRATLRESDLYLMLHIVLEYENLLFWRRDAGEKTALLLCQPASFVLHQTPLLEAKLQALQTQVDQILKNQKEELDRCTENTAVADARYEMTDGLLRNLIRKLSNMERPHNSQPRSRTSENLTYRDEAGEEGYSAGESAEEGLGS